MLIGDTPFQKHLVIWSRADWLVDLLLEPTELVMVHAHFTGRDHARKIHAIDVAWREFLHVITREIFMHLGVSTALRTFPSKDARENPSLFWTELDTFDE